MAKGLLRPLAVEGDVVGLRRERDEETGKLADPRQSCCGQSYAGAGERIVAAGVEKDEVAAASFAELGQHGIERDGLRRDIVEGAQFGVDGNEVVAPRELKAVSGVVEEGNVGVGRLRRELADGALHRGQIEIGLERDLESQRFQRRGDVRSVVRRIGERAERSCRRRFR